MPAPQQSAFARKLGAFVALSEQEFSALDRLYARRKSFSAGRDMVHQGQTNQPAYILASGWVCSYKLLSGGARQIVDFQIPGDFLGLRSVLFRTADHNIEPVTRVEASEVLISDLLDTFTATPGWPPPSCGPRRAMRRWWWSIWWASGAAMPRNAPRISCSSLARG